MKNKDVTTKDTNTSEERSLFDRVIQILEETRAGVVRTVNSSMVTAYWLIGREIVLELQAGDERAEYGKQVIENLSERLTIRYGKGFSAPTLWNFRQFYQVYSFREQSILSPAGRESIAVTQLEDVTGKTKLSPNGRELTATAKSSSLADESGYCFNPQLSWSHYRALMRVAKPEARLFYEKDLEQAIITNLQSFLLELGKGFSFVARQKHIRFDDDDFYVDLVFYNFMLKCFVLIDLKIGKLTHQDVGQMDGYVRLFEDLFKVPGDNPTIGLILCSNKSEAVAKYSVLSEGTVKKNATCLSLSTAKRYRKHLNQTNLRIALRWQC